MKFSKFLISLFLIACLSGTYICATEVNNEGTMEINEIVNLEEKEIEKQKTKLKEEVVSLIGELRDGILSIDEKVEVLKETDEYKTYPTIRLNIDTPIFGIKSIINQKLRITKDVSAADIAKGYTIRYIVKNKIIKVPDVKVGNIIVSTKEINIEDELSITDYNYLILKLMDYKDKVESVENFLDTQTNKMFKDYISKEKKEKLEDIYSRLNKLNNDLLDKNSDLFKIYLCKSEEYSNLKKQYIELIVKKKQLDKKSSNVLIDSNELNELQKEVLKLESSAIDYLSEVKEIKDKSLNEFEIRETYLYVYSDLNNKLEYIEKYIESSKKEKIIENITKNVDISNNENEVQDNKTNELVESSIKDEKNKTKEIITIYDVFSDKSVNNMKNIITYLEKRMDELNIIYSDKNDNSVNKTDEDEYKEINKEQIEEEFESIIQKYSEFLKYEYTFYLDNVNGLLGLTNSKLNKIASVTETDIVSEAKYIYIDLPVNLENYLDTYNVESNIEIQYLISNFKKELNSLCSNYLKLVELYNKLNVDELLNKD